MSTQTKSAAIVPTREAVVAELIDSASVPPMSLGLRRRLNRELHGIERTERVTVAALETGSRILANATMSISYALFVSTISMQAGGMQGEEELLRAFQMREQYLDDMSAIVSIAAQKLKRAVEAIPESSPDFSLKDELGL